MGRDVPRGKGITRVKVVKGPKRQLPRMQSGVYLEVVYSARSLCFCLQTSFLGKNEDQTSAEDNEDNPSRKQVSE